MRKYVDYIQEHELTEAKIEARCTELAPKNTPEKIHLLERIIEIELSQYRFIKDEEMHRRIEQKYYPALCELAKIHGGRVEIDINESYYYASICYMGSELILDMSYPLEFNRIVQIIKDSDTVSIEAGDNRFTLKFTFEMNRKEKIRDLSQELQELKDAYKKLQNDGT